MGLWVWFVLFCFVAFFQKCCSASSYVLRRLESCSVPNGTHQDPCLCWAQHRCLSPTRTWSHGSTQVTLHRDAPPQPASCCQPRSISPGAHRSSSCLPVPCFKDGLAFSSGFLKEEAQKQPRCKIGITVVSTFQKLHEDEPGLLKSG